ncbi:M14 family zinc carboxypeptidase [Actinomadura alba]|uniref:M14 family zinc carboxypeptidase n=1 Tax=Actinomadura alba TaxID=406431 RepID=UPI001FE47AB9|nr:M14 family zinc carboxypeptidase [Actinomadura alba]
MSTALAAVLAGGTLALATPAAAEPGTAQCSPNTGDVGAESWTDHAELGAALSNLAAQRPGIVTVEQAGTSNRGRAIWSARVGTGPETVLVTSEIHGNEKTGTDAVVSLLRTLSANTPYARQLRDRITLVAIPKMNPDGAELDRRGNDRTWGEVVRDFPQLAGAQPAWNYYTGSTQGDDYASRPGFDVNRDYNPDLDYVPKAGDFPGTSSRPGWYIHPESRTVRDVYRRLAAEKGGVDAYVDLHHQAPCYLDEHGENWVTMSISGQFVPDPRSPAGAKYAEYADRYDFDLSRQINVAAYDALRSYGNSAFGNITLYPQNQDLPGTGLGSFALNGSGTTLFEVRGQTQSWGAKKRGQLISTVERGLTGILEGLGDGSLHRIDPNRYNEIPETQR